MLTSGTFKSAEIKPRLLRLDDCQIHWRRTFGALRPLVDRRVFKRVFGKGHLRLPRFFGWSSYRTLSHQASPKSLSVNASDTSREQETVLNCTLCERVTEP